MPEPRPTDHVLTSVRAQAQAWRSALQKSAQAAQAADLPAYAELVCMSNFSFLHGGSHAHELVEQAHALGYQGLAITDECSVAGSVRAHAALKEHVAALQQVADSSASSAFKLIHGARFALSNERPEFNGTLVCWVPDRQAWQGLCRFISAARMAAPKGQCDLTAPDLPWAALSNCMAMWLPDRFAVVDVPGQAQAIAQTAQWWFDRIQTASDQRFLGLNLSLQSGDDIWKACLEQAAELASLPLVATSDVRMHVSTRKPLHDVLTSIRLGQCVQACGTQLLPNAEAHLRGRARLKRIYPPEALAQTLRIAQRCNFSLDELRYDYPQETVLPGLTPLQTLHRLSHEGAVQRYPQGVPQKVKNLLRNELALIAECRYEMFFLTVEDIVRFARSQGILCQGRGSAANSVVCFCLGITSVDPMHASLLLERFISKERMNEPPDIDVDFEHQRREEVIQYIYKKYGRDRAALAATVISYRARSAIRDVGKALALPEALIDAFAKDHHWFDRGLMADEMAQWCEKTGVNPQDARLPQWLVLTREIMGFPRHLSQHVGGFVLTQNPLSEMVPIENASMPDRTVIQWDKDDLESLGMLKVDVLALGMLSAVARCLSFRNQWHNAPHAKDWGLADIPQEDAATYAMLRAADTLGTFQVESRAQQSMLPRLKPVTFYDLVVQVAIVRPGPIQGGMVHPYLRARERRKQGLLIEYEKEDLKPALERTLGVPIFQEQVMQIAMIAAGFTGAQADALRRSMAAWKKKGGVHKFYEPIINGMAARGYSTKFAERIFSQILGFGEYGFPESHAYSFALIAYVSCYLKCHEPGCFLAAMLNSQPLGFYTPSQLVQDAQRHGVEVLPADVNHSDWDCSMPTRMSVRLGLRMVGGLGEAAGLRIQAERHSNGPYSNTQDLSLRARLDVGDINALAAADALQSLAGHRRQQVWQAAARVRTTALLRHAPIDEPALDLPAAPLGEEVLWDHASTGLSLRAHPVALLRRRLNQQRIKGLPLAHSQQLRGFAHGVNIVTAGLVTVRQQPQTAKGTLFITLEDEFGATNVVVWRHIRERQRQTVVHARLLAVHGRWERETEFSQGSADQVCHLIAHELIDLTDWLGRFNEITQRSRDFH